jgi:DNA-directed RNA polymerase specialized sigma24 family protein
MAHRLHSGGPVHRIEASARHVQRFVSRRVGNRADAADLSQQTLLLACSKLHTFRGERILAWMYAIAQHVIIDYYRTRNRFQFVALTPDGVADLELALRAPADAVLAGYELRRRLMAWQGDSADDLHLEHQVAVLLADVYGYRDKDSAAILHMSLPSFKLLLHEARKRLKSDGSGPLPNRVSVACRVTRADLEVLRLKLIEGVTDATS